MSFRDKVSLYGHQLTSYCFPSNLLRNNSTHRTIPHNHNILLIMKQKLFQQEDIPAAPWSVLTVDKNSRQDLFSKISIHYLHSNTRKALPRKLVKVIGTQQCGNFVTLDLKYHAALFFRRTTPGNLGIKANRLTWWTFSALIEDRHTKFKA